ncbi:hypothetical protein KY495_03855 [Massilia sp. PAMC28688]|uniref:hypothetical protein n=1 Tax=Massilia sp. PAMC28688 TaxID=2861283 RepID=UPI001C639151|nr:hypothetical protein [Massilia sp. PAMC28688]QYF94364.1 hypothetical protein KY495_03855 [Massilia sp. PAMC28688]
MSGTQQGPSMHASLLSVDIDCLARPFASAGRGRGGRWERGACLMAPRMPRRLLQDGTA